MTLSGPFTVSDDTTTVACPADASLAPAGTLTCTASYSVTQADIDAGFVTNIASAHGFFGAAAVDSATDTVTVTATQSPALTIDKSTTTTTFAAPGDLISYSYLVTNSGNVTLSGPFTVSDDTTTVACPADASLAPAGTLTCTASYSVTQADIDAGFVTNIASAHGFFGAAAVDSATDTVTVTATQSPALTIDKSTTTTTFAAPGDLISYSYLVTNSGNVTLSGPFTVSDDTTTVACPADASLAPAGTLTCTASYSVTQADIDAGFVTNIASAHGFFGAAAVDSATDTVTVTATQSPALTIDKSTTTTTFAAPGDLISYSYLVTNSGT